MTAAQPSLAEAATKLAALGWRMPLPEATLMRMLRAGTGPASLADDDLAAFAAKQIALRQQRRQARRAARRSTSH